MKQNKKKPEKITAIDEFKNSIKHGISGSEHIINGVFKFTKNTINATLNIKKNEENKTSAEEELVKATKETIKSTMHIANGIRKSILFVLSKSFDKVMNQKSTKEKSAINKSQNDQANAST